MDPITAIVVALVMITASVLISSSLMKGQKLKPASLEEFDFPQVEEGKPQDELFGQAWAKGWQVLWFGELSTIKIKSSGKKGGK